MWVIYVLIGLIAGIVISQAMFKFERRKGKMDPGDLRTIFQLVEDSKDVIYHYDVKPEIKFRYISPALEIFLGPGTIKEALEQPHAPFERIHPEDHENLLKKISGELDYNQILIQRWRDNNGQYRWFEEYATPIYEDGEIIAIQGIMRNIDEKIKIQQDLEYQINHDALTGICNRGHFENMFAQFNEQIDTSIAIILCDLDDLKSINDHFGHKEGDALIKSTAELLNQFTSEGITVSRIGGDEFVFIVAGREEKEIEQLVHNIRKQIDLYNRRKIDKRINMSIGYAFSKNSIGQISHVFSEADKNMYKNKNRRKLAKIQ